VYYAILNRVESVHQNVDTNPIKVLATSLPQVGNRLLMYTNELKLSGTSSYILTTAVLEVNSSSNEIVFRTKNSIYALSNIVRAKN